MKFRKRIQIQAHTTDGIDRWVTVFIGDKKQHSAEISRMRGCFFTMPDDTNIDEIFEELIVLARTMAVLDMSNRFINILDNHSGGNLISLVNFIKTTVIKNRRV
jgi:hypothetical protein